MVDRQQEREKREGGDGLSTSWRRERGRVGAERKRRLVGAALTQLEENVTTQGSRDRSKFKYSATSFTNRSGSRHPAARDATAMLQLPSL
jgi:hypothetical protein